MAQAQETLDRLAEIRDAGWTVPPSHPDLVPISEAGQLENLLRAMLGDAALLKRPADFARMLRDARAASQALEDGIGAKIEPPELSARYGALSAACKRCHTAYRDNR